MCRQIENFAVPRDSTYVRELFVRKVDGDSQRRQFFMDVHIGSPVLDALQITAEASADSLMPFVDDQGKEALNFQITVSIAVIVCAVLIAVLIGLLLLPIVGIAALVLTIIAGLKANNGETYRYPMTLRLIS